MLPKLVSGTHFNANDFDQKLISRIDCNWLKMPAKHFQGCTESLK